MAVSFQIRLGLSHQAMKLTGINHENKCSLPLGATQFLHKRNDQYNSFSDQITEDEMNFKTISQVDYAFSYLRRDFVRTPIYYFEKQSQLLPIIKAQSCSRSHLKGFGAEEPMDNSQLPYCASHFALKSFETELKLDKLDGVFHQHFIMLIYYSKTNTNVSCIVF